MDVLPTAIAQIKEIRPDSPLETLGVEPGWFLYTINEQSIDDIITYTIACSAERLHLVFKDDLGNIKEIDLKKEPDKDLGLVFTTATIDEVRTCANNCAFCFVDQMPPGMRPSLYVKDDDYRLSFLGGSYVTLCNFGKASLERIVELKLSPMYVSVHTLNPDLRVSLLGSPVTDFQERLTYLTANGISLHCQLVLCPGYNDGEDMLKTLDALAKMRPGIASVTVVPVGLTKYRQNLKQLRTFNAAEAMQVIDVVELYSKEAKAEGYGSWVWAADEFYLKADQTCNLPLAEDYEDFAHLENGVGLLRSFKEQWRALPSLKKADVAKPIVLVTGVSGEAALIPIQSDLRNIYPDLKIAAVPSLLFGGEVTVTGLVTAGDILAALPPAEQQGKLLILPDVMLREGTEVFLDDLSFSDFKKEYSMFNAEILVIPSTALGLFQALGGKIATSRRRPIRRSF